ncbi:MAG: cellulase family glycosylhydrolase [Candidatus Hadarchaeota archaeon]
MILLLFSASYFAIRFAWQRMPFTIATSGEVQPYVVARDNGFYLSDTKIKFEGVGIMPPIMLDNKGVDFSKYMAEIKAWGANTIRVPVYPVIYYLWENVPPWGDVDRAVVEARKNGLMIVLDFHSVGYPPEETYHTEPTGEQTENIFLYKNEWLFSFWEEASLRYRYENTVVAYEIFNEVKWPKNDNCEVGWLRWKAFAEENIIGRIRKNDPYKMILVSGLHYARDLYWAAKYPISDNNVSYKRTSYYDWSPKVENVITLWAETDEYSLAALEARGESWIAYVFSADWAPNLLLSYDNFTPSVYGRDVRGYLQDAPPTFTGPKAMEILAVVSATGVIISGLRLGALRVEAFQLRRRLVKFLRAHL